MSRRYLSSQSFQEAQELSSVFNSSYYFDFLELALIILEELYSNLKCHPNVIFLYSSPMAYMLTLS